jgi:hypothetical protein
MMLATAALVLLAACGNTDQSGSLEQRQIADLEARVAALEAQLADLEGLAGVHDETGLFEVAVAQYVMDTAGFHAIDEGLNETGVIEASYISSVNRVSKVIGATTWPDELHEPVDALVTVLADFAAALEADDAETAAGLAATVHEVQHDLSHAIDGLLGSGHGE